MLQLKEELKDFSVWLQALCEYGHFYVCREVTKVIVSGAPTSTPLGQCIIKQPLHNMMGSHAGVSLGLLAPKAYKI